MKEVNVKFHVFEGPLDLLYHLIEKNEIDIYDIPIAELTDQYISYLSGMRERDMESMSEFLVMAATLLETKSKMLLPKPVDNTLSGEDPRDKLIQHLLEYKMYKEVTEIFKEKRQDAEKLFFRKPGKIDSDYKISPDEVLDGLTLNKLYSVFETILKRRELKTDKVRASFSAVSKDLYTIRDKMAYVEDLIALQGNIKFSEAFSADARKMEKVVTFLAILELIRLKRVLIKQDENFDEILIEKA